MFGFDQLADKASCEGFGGIDGPAGVDQLLGICHCGHSCEALRAAPARDDPQVDLRLAELHGRGGNTKVSSERELAAAAECVAVDRRDGRLRHRLEQRGAGMPELSPLARLEHAESLHVLDVGARDKGSVAGAGEHDDPRLRVDGQLCEPLAKRASVLEVERVQSLHPVDDDDRGPTLPLDADRHQPPSRR